MGQEFSATEKGFANIWLPRLRSRSRTPACSNTSAAWSGSQPADAREATSFLGAFRVEIHYDVRTGRATFKTEIRAETIEELARQARRPEAVRWEVATSISRGEAADREGPAVSGRPQTIMGSSLSECPRRVPYRKGTRRSQQWRRVRGGGRCVGVAAEGSSVAVTGCRSRVIGGHPPCRAGSRSWRAVLVGALGGIQPKTAPHAGVWP